jgi:hypothetical protein
LPNLDEVARGGGSAFGEKQTTADRPLNPNPWSPSMPSPVVAEAVAKRSPTVLALVLMAALTAATAALPLQEGALRAQPIVSEAAR